MLLGVTEDCVWRVKGQRSLWYLLSEIRPLGRLQPLQKDTLLLLLLAQRYILHCSGWGMLTATKDMLQNVSVHIIFRLLFWCASGFKGMHILGKLSLFRLILSHSLSISVIVSVNCTSLWCRGGGFSICTLSISSVSDNSWEKTWKIAFWVNLEITYHYVA